jgi:hypothetical protein
VTTVDLEKLSASDLDHLAHLRRQVERRQAELRVARVLDLMDRPAIGYYRNRAKAVTQ